MTDLHTPREDLSQEYACEEISALYKRIQCDTDRANATKAFGDGVHQDRTVRDYSQLFDYPLRDLTREDRLLRDFYQYGSMR